ncbi:choice-of-anchor P family protein [Streptomyces sp. NBC_01618]|uniref:choice-of-anchor P family protein n=1 Tax=Streptomyces sp. NBC_01618 TaxID=2975900 RepID=UPI00386781B7|nr:M23 family metallopeptidase [Streptomyces sp. NBC_01618]
MKKRSGTLLAALAATLGLILAAPVAQAAEPAPAGDVSVMARPDFLAPFECDTTWKYFTRVGHGGGGDGELSLDFNLGAGDEDLGLPVLAAADGTAEAGDWGADGGQYVQLAHPDGWVSKYLHLNELTVKTGDEVKRGDQIGTVGKTGGVDYAHLHHEQWHDGSLVPIWMEGKELEYPYDEENAAEITSTNGCDGQEPPVQKDTALAYDGPTSIANGSPVELSATLTEKEGGAPVDGREVSFALGEGDNPQTCEGTTDAKGVASCPIDSVDQPWAEGATIPLTVTFAGDDDYKASETSAELKLQYVSGRAYGLSAKVPVLLLPLVIAPTPDTGEVRTAGAQTVAPACAQGINALVLSADALCAEVVTDVGPSSATATSTVSKATVGLPGLPVIQASGLTASSTSTCTLKKGSTALTLSIAGTPVTVPDTPNHTIDLGVGVKAVINEQTETADGLTVNALHVTGLGGIDVVIGSSTSAAHNCV